MSVRQLTIGCDRCHECDQGVRPRGMSQEEAPLPAIETLWMKRELASIELNLRGLRLLALQTPRVQRFAVSAESEKYQRGSMSASVHPGRIH